MELADEVKMLKTDLSAIEHEARKLGMIKPNEKTLVSGR
jgi:cell division protein FtsB